MNTKKKKLKSFFLKTLLPITSYNYIVVNYLYEFIIVIIIQYVDMYIVWIKLYGK